MGKKGIERERREFAGKESEEGCERRKGVIRMGDLEKKEKLQETVRRGWGNAEEKMERSKKKL
jgi:hypothetical protein